MDIDLARHCLRVAFRAGGELEGCAPDEYDGYRRAIAVAMYEIGVALTNKAIAAYPELEAEIEAQIQKYGRYL